MEDTLYEGNDKLDASEPSGLFNDGDIGFSGRDPSGCSYEIDGCDSGVPSDVLVSLPQVDIGGAGQGGGTSDEKPSAGRWDTEELEACADDFSSIRLYSTEYKSSTDSGFHSGDASSTVASCEIFPIIIQRSYNGGEDESMVSYVDEDGDSILHTAIVQKREEVVAEILKCYLPTGYVDIKDRNWRTALHLSVLTDQPNLLPILMNAGSNPFSRDLKGDTPLHVACREGFFECLKILVTLIMYVFKQPKFDPDLRNYNGYTCLHVAVAHRHYHIVMFLVHYFRCDINAGDGCSGRTSLHHVADVGDAQMARFLIKELGGLLNINALAHDQRTTPLMLALGRGHSRVEELLLSAGAIQPTDHELYYEDSEEDSDTELFPLKASVPFQGSDVTDSLSR